MAIAEGQKLGNYKILARIGVGGMGSVYLAEHPLIGKKVALKIIHRELAGNKEIVARFFNEARSVNKIGNEHIVEIHDFGQTPEGEHFFIMEYLEGRTLEDVLKGEPVLEVQRALHIAAQIANGLGAAHSCGIIHRDLKPDNIMLLERLGDPDFVKVLDFGLAKMFADAGGAKLTGAGVVLGTPQYMSPEACESKPGIDHRADIYSLGVLLFQLLCGRVPFEGESMGEIMVKHVAHAPPAPRAFNPEVPPSVEQIILRCLAKEPDGRFPTMKALREALLDPERYLASSPPVMPSAPVVAAPEARTVFAAAAPAGQAAARAGTGRELALQPPPPSLAGVASPEARTMFLGGSGPGGEAPPAQGADAKTAFMSATDQIAASRKRSMVPDMCPPAPAVNSTMVIGTPEGYSDKPPARRWPLVVALLSVVVVAGAAAAALVWPGFLVASASSPAEPGGDAPPAPEPPAATDQASGAAPVDEPAEEPVGAVAPELARITLHTDPTGAEVLDHEGKRLGRTPLEIALARDGTEHELLFRHPEARERRKSIVAEEDSTITVELERIEPESQPPEATGSGQKPRPSTGKRPKPRPRPDQGLGDGVLKPQFGP